MHDWMIKVFMPLMGDENYAGRAKRLYEVVKKYDVSDKEYLFIQHCAAYMNRGILSSGLVRLYDCTLEEAGWIVDAVTF